MYQNIHKYDIIDLCLEIHLVDVSLATKCVSFNMAF